MIETLWVTNPDGDTLELNLRSSETDHGLLVFNMSGLGPPKGTVSGTAGPSYDGIRGTFVRTDARHIILTLAVTARGDAEETAKQLIYDYFPIKGTIILGVTTGIKDVYTEAIVETNEMNEFAKVENAVIGLYCADPYFLDLIEQNVRIPYDTLTNVPYVGEVPTGIYMELIIGGTIIAGTDDIVITNSNRSQSMTIDLTLVGDSGPGDKIYIDTRSGQKSIIYRDAVTFLQTNLLPGVSINEDWIQLYPGDNNITVTSTIVAHADMPDPADLVAYVPLNEIDGGDALELHGGDDFINNDTIIGDGPGKVYPNARQFNIEDSPYLANAAPNPDLCPTGDFTIVFWGKVDSFANFRYVIHTNYGSSGGYYLRASTGSPGSLIFGIMSGGTTKTESIAMEPVGGWEIYFAWYDASATTMYIQKANGSPVSQGSVAAPGSYSYPTNIGGIAGSSTFDGQLQALAFYGSVLTSDERLFYLNLGEASRGRTYAEAIGEMEIIIQFRPLFEGV